LDLVRLPKDFAARLPAELSGGQRQRVGVARALAAAPAIMLMDEPFAALDPLTREGLGEDYRALHDQLGLTTVMITHDMLEALSWADRIVVLSRGRIVAEGPPSVMIDNAEPDVAELIAAPRRHAQRIGRLFAGTSAGGAR
jgi:osmoprotectant transport system ATP-binding protein